MKSDGLHFYLVMGMFLVLMYIAGFYCGYELRGLKENQNALRTIQRAHEAQSN